MIIELHRGHVTLEIDGKRITIEGEAHLRGFGSPDFVAYKNSIQKWDPPNHEPLSPDEISLVIETMRRDFDERKMVIEIE